MTHSLYTLKASCVNTVQQNVSGKYIRPTALGEPSIFPLALWVAGRQGWQGPGATRRNRVLVGVRAVEEPEGLEKV